MEKFLFSGNNKRCRSEDASETSVRNVKKKRCRKYEDTYLDFGFISAEINDEERPQCVICMKILAAESMLPNKLKRHLESNHRDMVDKPREYFQRKAQELRQQKVKFCKSATISNKALHVSYKVAHRIAKCKKPHTIAEELILPAAIDMVNTLIGESAGKLLSSVPLSNDTVSRRIQDMAEDLNDQLIGRLKGKEFALQLDEAIDSNKDAHLICYIRFVDNKTMIEDLLFCSSIVEGTKAQDLFNILNKFIVENNLEWENCIGVCTDGARAMSGCYSGLQAIIKSKAPNALWTHCIIHREALASKNVSQPLNLVLARVIKVVNFIKTRPLKARLFKKLCEDMGAEHLSLLFYCDSRWLSCGNMLIRVFELRYEVYVYLLEEGHEAAECFIDPDFVMQLAFLADIFEKLNILNRSLQGRNMHILKADEKISAFKKKLQLWSRKMNEDGGKDCFPSLHQFLTSNELELSRDVKLICEEYLTQLDKCFRKYFPEGNVQKLAWIQDPFNAEATSDFSCTEAESFIELSCDNSMKTKFRSMELTEFWLSLEDEYPLLCIKAQRILIPFCTSYLCEAGFSAVAVIKNKYRSKIDVEREMRVALSSFTPRFEKLCGEKQAQLSH